MECCGLGEPQHRRRLLQIAPPVACAPSDTLGGICQ
jgi:hypothetical protein